MPNQNRNPKNDKKGFVNAVKNGGINGDDQSIQTLHNNEKRRYK